MRKADGRNADGDSGQIDKAIEVDPQEELRVRQESYHQTPRIELTTG